MSKIIPPPPQCYFAIIKCLNRLFMFFLTFFIMLNYSLSDPPTPCSWTGCDEDWYEEISPITGDTNGCSFLVYYR
jgi:hypothetical protein